jgi:hypothetical protein
VSAHRYRIRVVGRIGAAATDPFDGLEVIQYDDYSEIRGLLDQTALFGVLQRIQVFALELVDVERED